MKTTMSTSDSARKIIWEESLFRDIVNGGYFLPRFASEAVESLNNGYPFESSPDNIIQVTTKLESRGRSKTMPGDKITFTLIPRIDPKVYPGVRSGQTLENKEVNLSWYTCSLELERYRQGVSLGGVMDWQRSSFDIPDASRVHLKAWGVELMDLLCIEALDTSPTSVFYSTDGTVANSTRTTSYATAFSAITTSSKLTPELISLVKTWATTGGAHTAGQVPLSPIYVDGEPFYVLLVHPDALFDWVTDSEVQQAHREARERGRENPIFKGAQYIWDGVVIHAYPNVTIGTNAGAGGNVPYAHCHFLGAQALLWAWGERPSIVERDVDYEEDFFAAWRMTARVAKPTFNSKDYGSVSVLVARRNISGL